MIGFLVGILTCLLTVGLWTKKYMPGEPEHSDKKYFIYTFGVGMPLSIFITILIKMNAWFRCLDVLEWVKKTTDKGK